MAEQAVKGWLTDAYDYERPRRGQVRESVILGIEERGVIIDVGLKRDGFAPSGDVARMGKDASSQFVRGQEVVARVVRPEDRDGNLDFSLYQARLVKD